jgi:hypothetical protein
MAKYYRIICSDHPGFKSGEIGREGGARVVGLGSRVSVHPKVDDVSSPV